MQTANATARPKESQVNGSHDFPLPSQVNQMSAGEAAMECFDAFARQKPAAVALWAFGVGFVLGWKLRIF